jgi:hypothetical protein
MGDEYDYAEAAYWQEQTENAIAKSQLSINRDGIQWASDSPTVDEAQQLVSKFNEAFPRVKERANKMRTKEQLLADAKAKRDEADQLERIATERDKYGTDPFKNGTMLRVDMKYRTGNRSYAYAVIKVAGRFYLSGRMGATTHDANSGMTWDNFVAWLAQGDATVWRAKQLEQVL